MERASSGTFTNLPICRTCGVHYGAVRRDRPICEDERQYVGWGGQQWTTLDELRAAGHQGRISEEGPEVIGIGTGPGFAVGQRALCRPESSPWPRSATPRTCSTPRPARA